MSTHALKHLPCSVHSSLLQRNAAFAFSSHLSNTTVAAPPSATLTQQFNASKTLTILQIAFNFSRLRRTRGASSIKTVLPGLCGLSVHKLRTSENIFLVFSTIFYHFLSFSQLRLFFWLAKKKKEKDVDA